MAVVSSEGRFLRVNRALCKLAGYTPEELATRRVDDLVDADDPAVGVMTELRALADTARPFEQREKRYRRSDGSVGWMLLGVSALQDADGAPLQFVAQIRDISERRKAEEELRLAASVFENTMDGIMVTDASARIISVNPAFTAITGYGAEEVLGQRPNLTRSEQETRNFCSELWDVLRRDGRWEGEAWNRRKSGEVFLERLTVSMVPGPDGRPVRYVGVFNDITELRRKDEHICHLAFHDPLTELPNRTLLLDRLEHSIAFARREKQHLGLMFVDLDRFKVVNDSLGHDVGDALLQEVAQRLLRCVRQSDTVARMGGDEFVVLLEHAGDLTNYAGLARKIIASLAEPTTLRGHTIPVGTSIGIACFPGDGNTVVELMKCADIAMYAAKAAGRGTYRFFQPPMSAASTVYLVDDDESFRNAMERLFRSAGFDFHPFSSGAAFLERFAPSDSACVVLDLRMPDLGGLEVLERLRKRKLDVPVIVYSGNADVQVAVQAMQLGAFAIVEKPFSNELLIRKVHDAIAAHRQLRARRSRISEACSRVARLTERERGIARLLADGLTAQDAADKLDISPRTVEAHRANIFRKLDITSSAVLAQTMLLAELGED